MSFLFAKLHNVDKVTFWRAALEEVCYNMYIREI